MVPGGAIYDGHHHARVDAEVSGVLFIGLNNLASPRSLAAIEFEPRALTWAFDRGARYPSRAPKSLKISNIMACLPVELCWVPSARGLVKIWSNFGSIASESYTAGSSMRPVMPNSRTLFGTVPDRDYLGFWADQTLKAREVADFLDLDKPTVAKLAQVAPASVRFDQKIPKEVLERLQEIANICGLVAQFFGGDIAKTAIWFRTKNPLLGDISPRDMIRYGRYEKLRRFIMNALQENSAARAASNHDSETTRTVP
jgi:hypothetical protein